MTSFRSLLYLLSTAVLLVRSSYILDQAEKVYPDDEEREKNLISALDTLKRLRLEAAKENNGRPQKPKSNTDATVLCVTFIEPSFQHLAVAEYNMKASSKYCDDWGVLYVGDDDLKIMQSLEKSAASNNVTLQFIEQSKTAQEMLESFVSPGQAGEYYLLHSFYNPNSQLFFYANLFTFVFPSSYCLMLNRENP